MLTHSELRALITGRTASFSVGVRGVLAEFHWVTDDRIEHDDGGLEVATARGAVAIRLNGDEQLCEVGGDEGHGDGSGARVCWLEASRAALDTPTGLRERGSDHAAVRQIDRAARLFDLGLALGHVRACVRTADPALLDLLRTHQGDDILQPGHPAMAAIKAHGPHRVFESASARIEVFQPIPSRARRERTPPGPHTHVLPKLLGTPGPPDGLPPQARAVLSIHPAH